MTEEEKKVLSQGSAVVSSLTLEFTEYLILNGYIIHDFEPTNSKLVIAPGSMLMKQVKGRGKTKAAMFGWLYGMR